MNEYLLKMEDAEGRQIFIASIRVLDVEQATHAKQKSGLKRKRMNVLCF